MYLSTVHFANIKTTTCPAAIHKTFNTIVLNLIKETETLNQVGRLVCLPLATFQDIRLVYLSIVSSYLLLQIIERQRRCRRIPANTSCIRCMSLDDTILNTSILGDVTVSQMNVFKLLLCLIIHSPSHNVHNRCIPKRFTSLNLQLKLPPYDSPCDRSHTE